MKKANKNLLIALIALATIDAKSQDIHFSQIFETPLLRNPSLTGIFTGDIRLQSVYRTQWNTVTVPYQTTSISGEVKKHIGNGDDFISYGGQILYDKAGTVALTSTHILPAVNFNKSMSNEKNLYLSLGFMGGLVQRSLDRSKMTTNNQYDGTMYNGGLSDGETMAANSYSYFDGSAGMSVNGQLGSGENNNFFAGLAYHHFNQSKNISFYGTKDASMTPKWVASGGLRFSMTSNSFFTLQSDYTVQGTYKEIVGGALYSWKLDQNDVDKYILHAGAYMRWKDAIIPVAKIEFRPIAVAVSYDANVSQLKQYSSGRGGFEISLSYQKSRRYNSSIDAMRCPKF